MELRLFLVVCLLAAVAAPAAAQVPAATPDSIQGIVKRLNARIDSLEAGSCDSGPLTVSLTSTGNPAADSVIATVRSLSISPSRSNPSWPWLV